MAFSYHLHTIGSWHKGPEKSIFDHYCTRLSLPLELHEYSLKKDHAKVSDVDKIKAFEAELLKPIIDQQHEALVYVLDERGQQITSHELASDIESAKTNRQTGVHFIIGGAYGLSPELLQQAHRKIAFGKATWPHLLIRGMIAEQLYRAETITSGHPYHK